MQAWQADATNLVAAAGRAALAENEKCIVVCTALASHMHLTADKAAVESTLSLKEEEVNASTESQLLWLLSCGRLGFEHCSVSASS